jgi:ribulose-phosphate 3-epimerase
MSGIRIAPSVISADFGNLRDDLKRVEDAGADILHVDIMDGHFVPNITFGPDIVAKIKSLTKLPLDVHLMISRPREYVVRFIEAGAANITFHIESEDSPSVTISEIATFDCKVGISVKPKTPLSAVRDHLGQIDRLLIMTVEPGFGGQKFMPGMMPKVEQAVEWRSQGKYDYDIEVDGGLDPHTTVAAVQAGAEVIVAGTAVFGKPDLAGKSDLAAAIKSLRDAAAYAIYQKQFPEAYETKEEPRVERI